MKNIKDYLNFYLGCDYQDQFGGLGNINEHTFLVMFDAAKRNVSFKLLLRALSDMTEDEAIELVKLRKWKQYGQHPHTREYTTYKNSFNDIVVSWGDGLREKNVPATKEVFDPAEFQYLLSKGFDLFNLIPEGLAIDKTKITDPIIK